MPKNFETTIELSGKIDPSVAKAVGLSVKELYKINQAYNTIAKLQKQANLNANGLPPVLQKTTVQIEKANRAAQELGNSFKRVQEIAAGVFEGEFFLGALEKGLDIVKEIGNKIKEFGVDSLSVRGKREVLQNQSRSMLESLGRGGQFGDLDMMMRNMEGRETMIKYSQLLASTNRLVSSAPGRFNSVESIHGMLGRLSDVMKDPATFDLATQAFTRILAAGKLDSKHIQELGFDTGYSFGPAIAKALNMSPEQMTDAMKKHKISGSQGIDALFKAFDIITGFGGAAYKHAEAQLKGWEGVVARWEGHMEDFKESFGKQLENFFSPIAEEIFKYLTPAALTHAFDGLEQFSRHMGQVSADLFSGIFIPLETRLPLFTNTIEGAMGGFTNWIDSFFVTVEEPVNGIHSVMKTDGFNAINKIVDGLELLNGGLKNLGNTFNYIGGHLEEFRLMSKLLMDSLSPGVDFFSKSKNIADDIAALIKLEGGSGAKEAAKENSVVQDVANNIIKVHNDALNIGVSKLIDFNNAIGNAINTITTGTIFGGSQMTPTGNVSGAPTGSWEKYTDYGPGVKGDQPGGKTYDYNSYHGIGAYGKLSGDSAAMHRDWAWSHYHVRAKGYYRSDRDGSMHRYMDETGAKNPKNEDFFHGADIKVEQHFHIQGDSDHIIRTIKERSSEVARHVHSEIREQMSRSAVI
jgi:hypothetical protein